MNIDQEDYIIKEEIDISNKDSYNSSYIYGEVDSHYFIKILKNKILYKYYKDEYNNLKFIDIGSGCGRLILEIAKLKLYSTGIEILSHRYDKSIKLLDKLDNDELFNNIDLINDSFSNIHFGNFDILYCCNIIFSDEDNNLLYNKLLKEFYGYAFLYNYNNKIMNNLISKEHVKTSWNNNVEIFIFYFKKN
tara:strand:- start:140 stop:712 length:573 start_codon:yes stop_codon:yes gene_type:complete